MTPDELDSEYTDAADFLRPNPLPREYAEPPRERGGVAKTQQFLAAARADGLEPALAPIAVTFRARDGEASDSAPAVPGVPFGADNLHGRPRHTCMLVGECDIGCNEGAKNSLDYTYLSRFLTAGETARASSPAVRQRASRPSTGTAIGCTTSSIGPHGRRCAAGASCMARARISWIRTPTRTPTSGRAA